MDFAFLKTCRGPFLLQPSHIFLLIRTAVFGFCFSLNLQFFFSSKFLRISWRLAKLSWKFCSNLVSFEWENVKVSCLCQQLILQHFFNSFRPDGEALGCIAFTKVSQISIKILDSSIKTLWKFIKVSKLWVTIKSQFQVQNRSEDNNQILNSPTLFHIIIKVSKYHVRISYKY